jgi:PfaD family protein
MEKLTTIDALRRIKRPLFLLEKDGTIEVQEGQPGLIAAASEKSFAGMVLPCSLESMGDASFCSDYGIRYPYVGGSMAKGISSVEMVKAFAAGEMLGFFGAAGLSIELVEGAIDQLMADGGNMPFGINLIHSPNEPQLENDLVDLYLKRNVTLLEASAFLDLTLPVVRYRTHGIYRDESGQIITPNRIMAKVSREEVAAKFFAPAPEKYLKQLVASGDLSEEQAILAANIPMAQDVTVEA